MKNTIAQGTSKKQDVSKMEILWVVSLVILVVTTVAFGVLLDVLHYVNYKHKKEITYLVVVFTVVAWVFLVNLDPWPSLATKCN